MTVVIPVRNGGADVDACLASLMPEAGQMSADVVVVDDASTDDTTARASAHGARVLTLASGAGPYVARNAGWRSSEAPLVVFTDVRNRAAPGWLAGLLAPFDDPTVAVAGGRVALGGDERLAHRLARREDHVDPTSLLADVFLPYVTTSSMAVRRSALEATGGFAPLRSGADADLCWRIQLAGLGRVTLAPDSSMTCEPRTSVPDIWRQWRRYARSYVQVRTRYGEAAGASDNTSAIRPRLRAAARRAVLGPSPDPMLELVDVIRWGGYEVAYRWACRQARRGTLQ